MRCPPPEGFYPLLQDLPMYLRIVRTSTNTPFRSGSEVMRVSLSHVDAQTPETQAYHGNNFTNKDFALFSRRASEVGWGLQEHRTGQDRDDSSGAAREIVRRGGRSMVPCVRRIHNLIESLSSNLTFFLDNKGNRASFQSPRKAS